MRVSLDPLHADGYIINVEMFKNLTKIRAKRVSLRLLLRRFVFPVPQGSHHKVHRLSDPSEKDNVSLEATDLEDLGDRLDKMSFCSVSAG
jgi:hypothetical protein